MTTKKEEPVKERELPERWQILQLGALHLFAGSFIPYYALSRSDIKDHLIAAFGDRFYAISFGIAIIVTILTGFMAGLRGLSLFLKLIRNIKIPTE